MKRKVRFKGENILEEIVLFSEDEKQETLNIGMFFKNTPNRVIKIGKSGKTKVELEKPLRSFSKIENKRLKKVSVKRKQKNIFVISLVGSKKEKITLSLKDTSEEKKKKTIKNNFLFDFYKGDVLQLNCS